MFGSARRIEHDTPLPEATGLGNSETEVTADFDERADMKLLRLGLDNANDGCEDLAVAIVAAAADCVWLLLLVLELQLAELELLVTGVTVDAEAKSVPTGAAEPGRVLMSSYAGGDAPAPVNLDPIADSPGRSRSNWHD